MNTSRKTIWTIGHSTLTIDEFTKILTAFDTKIIADIRGLPGSKRYPHFNKENLEATLSEMNIGYFHLKNLEEKQEKIQRTLAGEMILSGYTLTTWRLKIS